MGDHDEVYGRARQDQLRALLNRLAERIQQLEQSGELLASAPELQRLLGDARSELFHYEVRCTYDTPEAVEGRRIVEEAKRSTFSLDDPEDEEPWRPPAAD
jgi:hypothetical protein